MKNFEDLKKEIKKLTENLNVIKEANKLKTYNGNGCAVKIFGEIAMLNISSGSVSSVKGGNVNVNIIATLPSNIQISNNSILWQQVTLVSENWAPINDVVSVVGIENKNVIVRCSTNHDNIIHIYGSIIIPSELVTITS